MRACVFVCALRELRENGKISSPPSPHFVSVWRIRESAREGGFGRLFWGKKQGWVLTFHISIRERGVASHPSIDRRHDHGT